MATGNTNTRSQQEREDSRKLAVSDAAKKRWRVSEGRETLLAELDPPLAGDTFTARQVCDYFGCSRSTLGALTRFNYTEMRELGYTPGRAGTVSTIAYPARSVLHVAMLMRPGSCDRADAIKKALGVWTPPTHGKRWRHKPPARSHTQVCRRLLDRAFEVAEAVQDMDPAAVWEELGNLDRYELQGLVMTFGATLPLEQSGLRDYLARLGQVRGGRRGVQADAASTGLALLVPPPKLGRSQTQQADSCVCGIN
jgi:hypothetical protein